MALAPDAYDGALARGYGGSTAQVRVLQRADRLAFPTGSPGAWYGSQLGAVVRVRAPVEGFVGPWIVTLAPLAIEATGEKAVVEPFGGGSIWRATVRWGHGGASFSAELDWPRVGCAFGLSGSFVELDVGLLSEKPQPIADYTDAQQIIAMASAVPGTRAARPNSAPTWTSLSAPILGGALGPVVPVPPFAVAVSVSAAVQQLGDAVAIEQYATEGDALSGANPVRVDRYDAGPSVAQNLVIAPPVHPTSRWVRLRNANASGTQTLAAVFALDLGAT